MPNLPVPAFGALVLAYLALRTLLSGGPRLLALLLGATALQLMTVALVHGYGVTALRPLLPVGATVIPPLTWINFRAAFFRRPDWAQVLPHLGAPLFAIFCRLFAPATIDGVVSLTFVAYGAAILWQVGAVRDLPLARIEAGGLPARIWMALGWALIGSALTDLLVVLAYASGHPDWAAPLIGSSATLALIAIGLLSAAPSATDGGSEEEVPEAPAVPAETEAEDAAILDRLDALMAREQIHLDAGLTLVRLARRLHLPEKRLSAAVNRATGENVSRHINGWRIRHACGLIEAGQSVTGAMLESGFNTKSNFNREFRRVTGMPPSRWRGPVPGGDAAFLLTREPGRSHI
ncbi:AraC family transcriptional regulator [Frigidibacter sp. SD6-1]|uniref:helix-turn-helix domain-containing protein n=1 Tax=Frigidibacter sp. SD6-1 TaxID=3032581 RepID=UPI0024DF30AB|nr:AraC family transcriptional regulator [Frigidibacter sp. SD6-1]